MPTLAPPYPVRKDGTFDRDVQIGGKWYTHVGSGSADDSSHQFEKIPASAVTAMAHYLQSIGKHDGDAWLAGSRAQGDLISAVTGYTDSINPVPNVPLTPGVGGIGHQAPGLGGLNPLSGITDFLNRLWSAITSAQFWIRAGEVVGGLLVLGLGLDAMLKSKPQIIANVNVQKALKAVK